MQWHYWRSRPHSCEAKARLQLARQRRHQGRLRSLRRPRLPVRRATVRQIDILKRVKVAQLGRLRC